MLLSGCVSLIEPMIFYKDKAHPKQDTSVFAVENYSKNEDGSAHGAVMQVDGKSTHDWLALNNVDPVWIRVLPGEHVFKIVYSKTSGQYMVKNVTVRDMQAKHVYVAHLIDYGMSYKIVVEDTGENSTYKEHFKREMTSKYDNSSASF